jgi:hypothetical protein
MPPLHDDDSQSSGSDEEDVDVEEDENENMGEVMGLDVDDHDWDRNGEDPGTMRRDFDCELATNIYRLTGLRLTMIHGYSSVRRHREGQDTLGRASHGRDENAACSMECDAIDARTRF